MDSKEGEKGTAEGTLVDTQEKNTYKEDTHTNIYICIFAIVLYGSTSLAQTIFNKTILATYPFIIPPSREKYHKFIY